MTVCVTVCLTSSGAAQSVSSCLAEKAGDSSVQLAEDLDFRVI